MGVGMTTTGGVMRAQLNNRRQKARKERVEERRTKYLDKNVS
jgi:hypothetical protein